jgi:SAM-dependent methyltransferase
MVVLMMAGESPVAGSLPSRAERTAPHETRESRQAIARADARCPACFGPGRALSLVVDGRYRLLRCRTCRTEYFRPETNDAGDSSDRESAYWERYKFELYSSDDVRRDYESRYRRVFGLAERQFGAIGSVVDIGTGIGNFPAWAAGTGRTAIGVDTDAAAVAAARARGVAAYQPSELNSHVADGSFDAGCMWDVIEHIYQPDGVVEALVRKIRPGGALLIETPDVRFPVRRMLLAAHAVTGGRVDFTSPMYYWEHKIYFSVEGLQRLLDRHGCEAVVIEKMTSPLAKMRRVSRTWTEDGHGPVFAFLTRALPLLERVTARIGTGNKTVLVARRRPDG